MDVLRIKLAGVMSMAASLTSNQIVRVRISSPALCKQYVNTLDTIVLMRTS